MRQPPILGGGVMNAHEAIAAMTPFAALDKFAPLYAPPLPYKFAAFCARCRWVGPAHDQPEALETVCPNCRKETDNGR